MKQNDLREYLKLLQQERPQDFVRVKQAVNPDREPPALLQRLEAAGQSPVLWFERVEESRFPLMTNIHGTRERLALALRVTPNEVNKTYSRRLQNLIEPSLVKDGPVQEMIQQGDDVDIDALPLVTPSDNCVAPYFGAGLLIARDTVSGIRNLSYNRLMRRGRNRLTFHAAPGQHLHTILSNAEARREEAPVAIALGVHPAVALGALAKVPFDIDEYECASALLQEPLPLVKCVSVDLEVPAHAEIVLEGKVLLNVREPEGPYDEFTRYAMAQDMQPVIEVTAITHRPDAIYQDIFGGSREHLLMGAIPKEASLLVKLKGLHPEVQGVCYPLSGCGRLHVVVSLGPHHPTAARRVLLSAFSCDHFLKHVFVVDEDVNIERDEEVLWAMGTCYQGDRDTIVLERMLGSSLDPSAEHGGIAAKVGFDCTRKKSNFPPRNRIHPAILDKMAPDQFTGTPL